MTYSDVPRMLTMAAVWLLMLTWQLIAYRANCATALALFGVFFLLILLSGVEIALARRRAFLREWVEVRGVLFRLLSHRVLLLALESLKSAAFAAFLFVSVLGLTARHWSLMFADVLLIGLLLPRFYLLLEGEIRQEYRFDLARRWVLWASTLFLWGESMLVLFFSANQDFEGLRWQEVITYAASAPDVGCRLVGDLAALVAAIDALGQWSVQNLGRSLQDLPQALMASVSLLVAAGLSLALAYAYSRALIGGVARPWTMWRQSLRGPD